MATKKKSKQPNKYIRMTFTDDDWSILADNLIVKIDTKSPSAASTGGTREYGFMYNIEDHYHDLFAVGNWKRETLPNWSDKVGYPEKVKGDDWLAMRKDFMNMSNEAREDFYNGELQNLVEDFNKDAFGKHNDAYRRDHWVDKKVLAIHNVRTKLDDIEYTHDKLREALIGEKRGVDDAELADILSKAEKRKDSKGTEVRALKAKLDIAYAIEPSDYYYENVESEVEKLGDYAQYEKDKAAEHKALWAETEKAEARERKKKNKNKSKKEMMF